MAPKIIKLIYNPVAGNKTFLNYFDDFFKLFNKYKIEVHRTEESNNIKNKFENINSRDYYAVIVSGGDGTINKVVNVMLEKKIDIPLGVIPSGTTNDFGDQINMPENYLDCFEIFENQNNIKGVDVGKVNNNYFINVCIGGNFSQIAHDTNYEVKNKLGRIAYYIKGIKDFPSLKPFPLKITTSKRSFKEEIYLFLIMNSKRAGGFDNLAQKAKMDDGVFDFIAVKAGKFYQLPNLLIKIFQNKHLDDNNIIYIQDEYFKIEHLPQKNKEKKTKEIPSDIDGEKGPFLPLEIKVLPQALRIFTPSL